MAMEAMAAIRAKPIIQASRVTSFNLLGVSTADPYFWVNERRITSSVSPFCSAARNSSRIRNLVSQNPLLHSSKISRQPQVHLCGDPGSCNGWH